MKRQRRRRSALAFAVLLAALTTHAAAAPSFPAGASAEAGMHDGEPRVEARLLIHPDDRGENRLRLGVLFTLDPGWHLYWRNPGESGLAPELAWSAPGLEIGPISWPAPQIFLESDAELTTFGYEGGVLLASEAQVVGPRPERIRVDAELLICRHECIPASLSLERRLDEASADPAADALTRTLFEEQLGTLPVPPESLGVALAVRPSTPAHDARAGARLELLACGPGSGCEGYEFGPAPAFIPYTGTARAMPDLANERVMHLELDSPRIVGVLVLRAPDQSLRHVVLDLPLETSSGTASAGLHSLLLIMGFALLGGLVLNAMPCVLPVLAIKIFAVTALAQHGRRAARRHGLAYLAGIEIAMLLFAGAVVALRAAGTSLGWGFQLQEPLFVAAIGTVLVVFALNLFGVFELGAPTGSLASLGAGATGARRSFFEGLLAVVLATPCTAPFLGTAVGFAFAAPPAEILAIFLCIGLGLASPFTLVALVPGWSRWVPRSGPWMLKVRMGLGFALLATVVWLVWVFGRTRGLDAAAGLQAFLLAVAFGAWLYGTLQGAARRWILLGSTGLAAALALSVVGEVRVESGVPTPPSRQAESEWRSYSPEAVAEVVRGGQRALVVFTADWCITCKVNERFALADDEVVAETALSDVVLFKADWTLRDERIRAALARFGRAGVPLTVVYHPAAPDRPVVLPELLTSARLLDALRNPSAAEKG